MEIKVRYDLGYEVELLDAVLVDGSLAVVKDGDQFSVVTVKHREGNVYDDSGEWGFIFRNGVSDFSDAVSHLRGMSAIDFVSRFCGLAEYELV
ncbi:hypothetical protein WD019_18960 [Fictibacillus sp. Mic-4]|uniref:hypothetical protein n=1 Tax=Fictibacillus sp. Mic-4 TaxID=3132826 RepID=UPI003CEE5488